MRRNKTITIFVLVVALLLTTSHITTNAHSGRTDAFGGHHDYQNKSGLGSYHYHHGYGPHLHPNGVCIYDDSPQKSYPNYESGKTNSDKTGNYRKRIYIENKPEKKLEVGECVLLTVVGYNDVFWHSSNEEVATVDDGLLEVVGAGTTTIEATADNCYSDSFTIRVDKIKTESIKIFNWPEKISVGDTVELNANIYPVNATNQALKWSSSDTNIIDISSTGEIVGLQKGVVDITVSQGVLKQSEKIQVLPAIESIKIESDDESGVDEIKLYVGKNVQLDARIQPTDAIIGEIDWESSNENIAMVSSDGKVTAIKPGVVSIEVSTDNNKTDTIQIKIKSYVPMVLIIILMIVAILFGIVLYVKRKRSIK